MSDERTRTKGGGQPSDASNLVSKKSKRSVEPSDNSQGTVMPVLSKTEQEGASSPTPSHLSMKSDQSMEPPQNFQRADFPSMSRIKQVPSPTPSYLSMKSDQSMDPPQNFRMANSPSMPRIKHQVQSPTPSYLTMKSDQSMDPPQNFQQANSPSMYSIELGLASPTPSHLSMKSEQSMGLPDNFKSGNSPLMPSGLVIEDHISCSECTEVLKDPVSIPCGHSYCRQCITSYWAQPNHAGHYACPQCSQTYSSCPALYTNIALAEMVQKLQHFNPAPPAGPGDVACDFCTGRNHKAVKSCLTCSASFCESHVRQHYTIPVLQRHRLVEAGKHVQNLLPENEDIKTEDLNQPIPMLQREGEQLICSQHNIATKFFCRTDKKFICSLCTTEAHNGHDIKSEHMKHLKQKASVSYDDEEDNKDKMKIKNTVLQEACQNKGRIDNVTDDSVSSPELGKMVAEEELTKVKTGQKIEYSDSLLDKNTELQTQYSKLRENNTEVATQNCHQTEEIKRLEMSGMYAKLQTENTELKEQVSDLETKNSKLLEENNKVEKENSELIEENCELDTKRSRLVRKIFRLEKKIYKLREENMELNRENVQLQQNANKLQKTNDELQEENKKCTMLEKNIKGPPEALPANVVLDPGTAHHQLTISDDGKSVTFGKDALEPDPENPQRFDFWLFVLGKEGFTSGRHYWQVETNRAWTIGVAKESAQRKGPFRFSPQNGYWVLRCNQLESFLFMH